MDTNLIFSNLSIDDLLTLRQEIDLIISLKYTGEIKYVNQLPINKKTIELLNKHRIMTIDYLCNNVTKRELYLIRGIGELKRKELKDSLSALGLSLNNY